MGGERGDGREERERRNQGDSKDVRKGVVHVIRMCMTQRKEVPAEYK